MNTKGKAPKLTWNLAQIQTQRSQHVRGTVHEYKVGRSSSLWETLNDYKGKGPEDYVEPEMEPEMNTKWEGPEAYGKP